MAKNVKTHQRFIDGIADYDQEGSDSSFAFGRSINVRRNPNEVKLLPRTIKESASTIQALPKWGEYVSKEDKTFIYDEAGNIYQRLTNGSYTKLYTAANSHGNGMAYFGEDDSLYYTTDKTVGRYGTFASSTPTFQDDYFGSQGGVPQNTHSLSLNGSTQYASRADTASLSLTGDLTLECQVKPSSLPSSGNTMTLISKWTEQSNLRSYKFGIGTISNFFGDGGDGALTISSNTTDSPIDSACTGTINTQTLTATNASFSQGQKILIHQSRGTGAGNWMINEIQAYTSGTITLVDPLNATYTSGAQVLVLKQYTNVTVNSGITWTAKAWNGTTGGILAFLANGTVTVTGTISATGRGFRGGASVSTNGNQSTHGRQGEGTSGAGGISTIPNGNGGAGGFGGTAGAVGSGGGGGHANAGSQGTNGYGGTSLYVAGGSTAGSADLTTMVFGGGGGSGGAGGNASGNTATGGAGGNGGGIIFISGVTVTVTGSIVANGNNGANGSRSVVSGTADGGGGGAGAAGSCLIKGQTITLGTNKITLTGGTGGSGFGDTGGNGSVGRIHADYLTSVSGTTTPTYNSAQDNSLSSDDGYSLFLSLSSNGTAVETLYKPLTITVDQWRHLAVNWDASAGLAEFFVNSVSIGTVTGSTTSLNDNASTFNIGIDKDSSGNPQNFYAGLIDEVRVWNTLRSSSQLFNGGQQEINPATSGLQGYFQFDNTADDETGNSNDLTLTGSPTYSVDVPFASPSTRLDIDQTASTSSQTYTLGTSINEGATHRKTFTPERDPQKSIAVDIDTVGTGDWTITVHDSNNNVIAEKTVSNASLHTGLYEFEFDEVWRPLTNFTNEYHFHIVSTVGDGKVTTGTLNDLETVTFTTYFQFLVEDTAFHPVSPMLQFLVFGNERYVGKLEATLYNPNHLILPSGFRVRCFSYWREYLAIGCIKGTSVTDTEQGRVYFWDGIAPTYNFYIDVPEGGVNALFGTQGKLYINAGYLGHILMYTGGDEAYPLKQLPRVEDTESTIIYPQGFAMWQRLLRIGASGSGNSNIEKGVYTFGKTNIRYNDALTYDFPISTGNRVSEGVRIGMLLPVKQKLLIGWSDGTGHGIDYIDTSNSCYETGTIEFLWHDDGATWKEKQANVLVAKCKRLTAGQLIRLKYRIDEEETWSEKEITDEGAIVGRITLSDGRYHEIQYAVDLESTSGTSPTLQSVGLERDDKREEQRV